MCKSKVFSAIISFFHVSKLIRIPIFKCTAKTIDNQSNRLILINAQCAEIAGYFLINIARSTSAAAVGAIQFPSAFIHQIVSVKKKYKFVYENR